MNIDNPKLAINGGEPISNKMVLIHKPYIDKDDIQAVTDTTESTFLSGDGPMCREFEKKLSEYLNQRNGVCNILSGD